jgi:hypothetical protein
MRWLVAIAALVACAHALKYNTDRAREHEDDIQTLLAVNEAFGNASRAELFFHLHTLLRHTTAGEVPSDLVAYEQLLFADAVYVSQPRERCVGLARAIGCLLRDHAPPANALSVQFRHSTVTQGALQVARLMLTYHPREDTAAPRSRLDVYFLHTRATADGEQRKISLIEHLPSVDSPIRL